MPVLFHIQDNQKVLKYTYQISINPKIENKIPPHVTIGAFHVVKDEEARLIQMVEEFTKSQKAGIVQFKEIGNFNGKVLFLKPKKDGFLAQINAELHSNLLPEFEKAENGYYLPEIWFPHTTLATRLNTSSQGTLSLKALTSPFAELKRLSLDS